MSEKDDYGIHIARHDERIKTLENGRKDDRATVSQLQTRLWGVVATVLSLVAAALFKSFGP
tara:strand:+ start:611 stop:793 length:183 start_codon:yes stop_codon:yes gene_type:complete